jgi:APA family basic amino acid/polyamine antiporter
MRRSESASAEAPGFRRELGLLDATVVVAGAIIGVGIFANPSNVARIVGDPSLILLAWVVGGLIAMLGGLAYAELGSRLPYVGGQYTYLARTYHPAVGFLYGIALLFIINGGGIAAVAMVFGGYLERAIPSSGAAGIRVTAAAVILVLSGLHVLGVRAGKWANNALLATKVLGMAGLMLLALLDDRPSASVFGLEAVLSPRGSSLPLLLTALVPIMFAYGGWQNCGAIAGEIRDPRRNLALANVLGVGMVVLLYIGLNVAYLLVLTPAQVAASTALAADVASAAAGSAGARLVTVLILVSCLGFLSVIILTGPRLYYAMAADGVLFQRVGALHPRFKTPAVALWLQALVSIALIATNTYDQLLSYVVFADWLFFGLAVAGLFVLRHRQPVGPGIHAMPGHPLTTILFVLAAVGIVLNSFFAYTTQSLIGSGILLAGAAAYFLMSPARAR